MNINVKHEVVCLQRKFRDIVKREIPRDIVSLMLTYLLANLVGWVGLGLFLFLSQELLCILK